MRAENMVKLSWRLTKIRAMTTREIFMRLRYKAVLTQERRAHRLGRLAPPDRLERALHQRFRGRHWRQTLLANRRGTFETRFFPSIRQSERMRALFETRFVSEYEDTQRQAAFTRDNRFAFFGHEFRFSGDVPWQHDPVTGRAWPPSFHADVPVHGGDVGFGDVKHVWELSRQQYLIDLAKAYFLGGNPDDLAVLQRLVASWIAGNPYATGVNWSCALEPAFRAWSWLWAYHLTAASLDDEFHLQWLTGFYDHGRFLARHLEHYSSPYNHLIGEASALYAIALCFPEMREADGWERLAHEVLETRLGEQFYPDGGSVEQSTFYHHATLGFYLLSALLARANGRELSSSIWAAIVRGIDFSMTLTQPDGRIPAIGGADDGKPIRMEHLPFWDFRPYQSLGACLLGRADWKAVAGQIHEDTVWLLGCDAVRRFDELDAKPPEFKFRLLKASGYAVGRSRWSEDADYVCFDIGEQAAGMRTDAVPNSMHGHADCLSVVLWLAGRAVLVDSGLFAYNCGGAWEAHFRETAAHNTARVDGKDQACHLTKMAWSHSYRATIDAAPDDDRECWAVGSHDGYARGDDGVVHRRAIWLRAGGYFVIHDEFVGRGDHALEVNFQFAPGDLRPTTRGVELAGAAEMVWAANVEWHAETFYGGAYPDRGWICRSLGVRERAPRLTLRARMSGEPVSLLTVIAAKPASPKLSVVSTSDRPLVAVSGAETDDWVAAVPGGIAICQLRDSRPSAATAIGANRSEVDLVALRRFCEEQARYSR